MEFTAKLVVSKTNPKARIAALGTVVLVLSIFVSIKHGYEHYALWGIGAGAALILLGAALAKGRLLDNEISDTDLILSGWEIKVGDSTYRLDLVKDIIVNVEVLSVTSDEAAARKPKGVNNFLTFSYCGEEQNCRFCMQSPEDVRRLGEVLRSWYAGKVPFVEKTRDGGRSFMLEPVRGEKELAERKKKAGYG